MHVLLRYISQYFNKSSFSNIWSISKSRIKKNKKRRKNNATVYVIRRLCNKKYLANSKPCMHCQSYLAKFGFKRIKYTDIINGVNVLCELKLKKIN